MSGQTLQIIEIQVSLGTLIGRVPATDYLSYQSNTRPAILALNDCFKLKHCVSMEVFVRMPTGLTS